MKAIVLHGKGDLRLQDVERPRAAAGEVVIRIRRAGICGSDIHYYAHGRAGAFVLRQPFILGHEFAGEVVEAGERADRTLVGRRVAVDPSMPCGKCGFCRSGRYNLCTAMRFFGSASSDPHVNGGFAEAIAVPAANCHPIPDTMSWAEAAMSEPLSVAIHAVSRGASVAGKSVLVTGGGAIGQLIALVARAFGASRVVLSDIAAFPRRLASELGADATLDASASGFHAEAMEFAPEGFEIVFEASGSPQALSSGIELARRGGMLVQVGTLPPAVTAPLNAVMARELSIVGSFRFAHVFTNALDLLASRRIDVTPLISAVLPLHMMQAAMDRAVSKDAVIKVQVEA